MAIFSAQLRVWNPANPSQVVADTGRRNLVEHDGLRLEGAACSELPGPPGQIDVLAVDRTGPSRRPAVVAERLVESVQSFEEVTPVKVAK